MLGTHNNLTGNARYEGFCIDLLKKIASIVGFTYRIELVPDGKYGVYNYETGEWNGIVRQLMDKVSDQYRSSTVNKYNDSKVRVTCYFLLFIFVNLSKLSKRFFLYDCRPVIVG